jgi:hypothetical protein
MQGQGIERDSFGGIVPKGFKMTKRQHQQVLNCGFLSLSLDCMRPEVGIKCPYWPLCSAKIRPSVKLVDLEDSDCPSDSVERFNKLMEEKGNVPPLYNVSK